MPLVGDELWNAVEAAVSNWREACSDEEGQALLSYLTGEQTFADELNAWLDESCKCGEKGCFGKEINEAISLTHLNGADSWKELTYALAGEVVDLQGTLDDINNGRDL